MNKYRTPRSTNALMSAVQNQANTRMTLTENGALTHATTANKVLDLFSIIGASRQNPDQALRVFREAFANNGRIAAQVLLWSRDCRGGAGERNVFRTILQGMENDPAFQPFLERIIPYVPEIGRYDDLLCFNKLENKRLAYEVIKASIWGGNGLAAKWMPRKGPLAVELRNAFGLSPKRYRKLLVGLTKVVEQAMCAKDWTKINYEHVPSVAAARYQKAFSRNDAERYSQYRASLVKGTAKIKATTIFPYDVIKGLKHGDALVAEKQWEALPNYFTRPVNVVPMIDTSGSMGSMVDGTNSAYDIAMSLGLYVTSKNTGALKDLAISFQARPKALTLSGSLRNRYNTLHNGGPAENTDLQAAFQLLLDLAVRNQVPQEDMPEMLLIVSDMEFDSCTGGGGWDYSRRAFANKQVTNFSGIQEKYARAGYTMPRVVFWNVMSRGTQNKPVQFREEGTALISGFSPAIMKAVLSGSLEQFTPMSVMLEAVDTPRYQIFGGLE